MRQILTWGFWRRDGNARAHASSGVLVVVAYTLLYMGEELIFHRGNSCRVGRRGVSYTFVCLGRSCGARQRTLRQVLEYSPQSTIRDCARCPCVFRISRLCRAAGETVFLLPAVLFSVAGGFFSSVGRVGGLSFCPPRFPFRCKSSAAGALLPGVFEFSYKK